NDDGPRGLHERGWSASHQRADIREATITIHTIGHSNRSSAEFIALLQQHHITRVVDIRLIPASRANPQFGRQRLQRALKKAGIDYVHEPRLGGRRRTTKDSINGGWRNTSFRGYADYMATVEFKRGLKALLALARTRATAIMCAEAVPWRFHRFLVSDA